ncbi:TPA_asm: NS1 [African termite bidnaparvovirus]|nr:TPA_asm: NS1 [African termite bidnaparvovirus]
MYKTPQWKKITYQGSRTSVVAKALELNVYDCSEFLAKAPIELVESIVHEQGSGYIQYVMSCLDVARLTIYKEQIKDRWQVLLDFHQKCSFDDKECGEWAKWFHIQGIDPIQFINDLKSVLQCSHPKKNTLRIWGQASTGKTMIVRAIAKPFLCHFQGMCGAHSDFAFEGFINIVVAVVEEAFFIPKEVEDWKTIMSGQSLTVNKKYQGKQTIHRTPVLMTSNHFKLGRGYVKLIDEHALQTRMFDYHANIVYSPEIKLTGAGFSAYVNELLGSCTS